MAQQSNLSPNVIAPSRENSVIRNQLTLAKKLEQQALQGLMAIPGDGSLPFDPASHQAARDAYILIRAARHGMAWQKEAVGIQIRLRPIYSAWTTLESAHPRRSSDWGKRAVRDADLAIRLLDQILYDAVRRRHLPPALERLRVWAGSSQKDLSRTCMAHRHPLR
jgi:hypothetical protein